jgi:CheY-like chemotaxis protein
MADTVVRPVVLVVDDDPAVRSLLATFLPTEGFEVLLAPDGRHAVELFAQQTDRIAVVLLDVAMPGMGGPETLAALRAVKAAVRCCCMTGYARGEDLRQLASLGVPALLEKPFHLDEVARVLRSTLGPAND